MALSASSKTREPELTKALRTPLLAGVGCHQISLAAPSGAVADTSNEVKAEQEQRGAAIDLGVLRQETPLSYTLVVTSAADLQRLCERQQRQISFASTAISEPGVLAAATCSMALGFGLGISAPSAAAPLLLVPALCPLPLAGAVLSLPSKILLPWLGETSLDAADISCWPELWRENQCGNNDPQWGANGRALADYLVKNNCLERIEGVHVIDGDAHLHFGAESEPAPLIDGLIIRVRQVENLRDVIAASPAHLWSPGEAGAHQRDAMADNLITVFAAGRKQQMQTQLTALKTELARLQASQNGQPFQQFLVLDAAQIALEQQAEDLATALRRWDIRPADGL